MQNPSKFYTDRHPKICITIAPHIYAAKAEKEWGLGREKRFTVLLPQLPGRQEISHSLKYGQIKCCSPQQINYRCGRLLGAR